MLARLLGMPLLRLHADVVLVPVHLRDAASPPVVVPADLPRTIASSPRQATGRASLDEARRLVRESERDLKALPAPVVPTRRKLNGA